MRKSFLFVVSALVAVIFMSSCNDDDDNPVAAPTITVTPSDDTVVATPGEIIQYNINWKSETPILSAKISYKGGDNQKIILDTSFVEDIYSFDYVLNVTIPIDIPGNSIFEFTFFGNNKDNSTYLTKYINVVNSISNFEGVKLQAQADGPVTADSNLTFYSATLNVRYTLNQSQIEVNAENIDIVFTHHSEFKTNEELSLKSPNSAILKQMWAELPGFNPPFDYDTSIMEQTYFKKVDVTDWETLTYENIEEIVGDIGQESTVKGLWVDDYVAFETHTGKKGILKITKTDINHNPYNKTFIVFDCKIQN
jgi:hypothetical protein